MSFQSPVLPPIEWICFRRDVFNTTNSSSETIRESFYKTVIIKRIGYPSPPNAPFSTHQIDQFDHSQTTRSYMDSEPPIQWNDRPSDWNSETQEIDSGRVEEARSQRDGVLNDELSLCDPLYKSPMSQQNPILIRWGRNETTKNIFESEDSDQLDGGGSNHMSPQHGSLHDLRTDKIIDDLNKNEKANPTNQDEEARRTNQDEEQRTTNQKSDLSTNQTQSTITPQPTEMDESIISNPTNSGESIVDILREYHNCLLSNSETPEKIVQTIQKFGTDTATEIQFTIMRNIRHPRFKEMKELYIFIARYSRISIEAFQYSEYAITMPIAEITVLTNLKQESLNFQPDLWPLVCILLSIFDLSNWLNVDSLGVVGVEHYTKFASSYFDFMEWYDKMELENPHLLVNVASGLRGINVREYPTTSTFYSHGDENIESNERLERMQKVLLWCSKKYREILDVLMKSANFEDVTFRWIIETVFLNDYELKSLTGINMDIEGTSLFVETTHSIEEITKDDSHTHSERVLGDDTFVGQKRKQSDIVNDNTEIQSGSNKKKISTKTNLYDIPPKFATLVIGLFCLDNPIIYFRNKVMNQSLIQLEDEVFNNPMRAIENWLIKTFPTQQESKEPRKKHKKK